METMRQRCKLLLELRYTRAERLMSLGSSKGAVNPAFNVITKEDLADFDRESLIDILYNVRNCAYIDRNIICCVTSSITGSHYDIMRPFNIPS